MTISKNTSMSSSKSYLIKALYDWIIDNNCTPYILVDAFCESVEVPQEYVKDGQIVLNISPNAITDLSIDKADLKFSARFAGIPTQICAPMKSILGIYARENGQGMMFDYDINPDDPDPSPKKAPKLVSQKKRHGLKTYKPDLKIVK
tara:strand:- start:7 stop:447 length:441 start_codon:yes stop_codon:yes gene_type:complete